MLNNLFIENLKCFTKQSIPLSNLTLLTGFNAAGKSTTIQSLLLTNQMVNQVPVNLTNIPLNTERMRLGTTGDVLNRDSSTRKIKLKFEDKVASMNIEFDASERSAMSLKLDNSPYAVASKEEKELLETLSNIIYISAMRLGTEDVYPVPESPDIIHADVGMLGQYAPYWFDQYKDEDISEGRCYPDSENNVLYSQFNAWSSNIFPGSQANALKIEQLPLVKLELRTSDTSAWNRPANIGYGLSYAFPIIVAGLLAKKGHLLIVDSPEAHLHPHGQSMMGRFLAGVAADGVQVILETHSDHILNGIRVAVNQKSISPEQVAIHFFEPNSDKPGTPKVTMPIIDPQGNLSEWPTGFFDQSDIDLAVLSGWGG